MDNKTVIGIDTRWGHTKTPTRGHPGDAGLDLYAPYELNIAPGQRLLVKTGVSLKIPHGMYGRIAPRSSLAYKYGIDVLGGVVDSTYTGNISVLLINHGDEEVTLESDSRIAQIIITPCVVDTVFKKGIKEDTERGEGGFGSTGK